MSADIRRLRPAVIVFGLAALAACADQDRSALAPTGPDLALTTGSTLVECPTDVPQSTSGRIDPLGGSLSVAGSSIDIPAGAVLVPTDFTLSVPASNYMEIAITANGAEHYEFESAVTVTIDYTRCTRSNIEKDSLSVWLFETDTDTLLENMGGTDDKTARTVTFGTDHLSEYAIAN